MGHLHLHCHSDRSVGRGLIKPSQLVEHYVANTIPGACITDNGNLSAAIQLYNACKRHSIKPIIGMEVNIAEHRTLKSQRNHSLVLLARNLTGFYNLVKLATIGAMYFYYQPRIDDEVLAQHSDGLIGLSSDLRGVGATAFFAKGTTGIAQAQDKYGAIFNGDFYWEIQPTQVESQRVYNEAILSMAEQGVCSKLVASGDPHYLNKEDRDLHMRVMQARNSRSAGWEYNFKGEYHVLADYELVGLLRLLHGYDVMRNDLIVSALDAPYEILKRVEEYDLRQQTKVPSYIE